MAMERRPTFTGKIKSKDWEDILFWATHKTPRERLEEAWRLHCLNHNVNPKEIKLNKFMQVSRRR